MLWPVIITFAVICETDFFSVFLVLSIHKLAISAVAYMPNTAEMMHGHFRM